MSHHRHPGGIGTRPLADGWKAFVRWTSDPFDSCCAMSCNSSSGGVDSANDDMTWVAYTFLNTPARRHQLGERANKPPPRLYTPPTSRRKSTEVREEDGSIIRATSISRTNSSSSNNSSTVCLLTPPPTPPSCSSQSSTREEEEKASFPEVSPPPPPTPPPPGTTTIIPEKIPEDVLSVSFRRPSILRVSGDRDHDCTRSIGETDEEEGRVVVGEGCAAGSHCRRARPGRRLVGGVRWGINVCIVEQWREALNEIRQGRGVKPLTRRPVPQIAASPRVQSRAARLAAMADSDGDSDDFHGQDDDSDEKSEEEEETEVDLDVDALNCYSGWGGESGAGGGLALRDIVSPRTRRGRVVPSGPARLIAVVDVDKILRRVGSSGGGRGRNGVGRVGRGFNARGGGRSGGGGGGAKSRVRGGGGGVRHVTLVAASDACEDTWLGRELFRLAQEESVADLLYKRAYLNWRG